MNATYSNTEFLLRVAHDAIVVRAARDEPHPAAYDAKRDPEGYVTSLLTALHHWCARHGLDWDAELYRAQTYFAQDQHEIGSGESSLDPPPVSELRCPECGHADGFFIEVTESLYMFPGDIQLGDDAGARWDIHSPCACPACHHAGTVRQFYLAAPVGG